MVVESAPAGAVRSVEEADPEQSLHDYFFGNGAKRGEFVALQILPAQSIHHNCP